MASTNKTTNYDLPQWIGTDKPTFQGDLNGAFNTIDNAMNTNKTNSELALQQYNNLNPQVQLLKTNVGEVENLDTTDKTNLVNAINEVNKKVTKDKVGNLNDLNTTSKSNVVSAINEVNSNLTTTTNKANANQVNIGTLANLNTTNKSNLVSAINEVNNKDLISINQLTPQNFIFSEGSFIQGNIYMAKNTNESMFKIYGYILWNTGSSTGARGYSIKIPSSQNMLNYRPSSRREFTCVGGSFTNEVYEASIFLETNGDITIEGSISVPSSIHCTTLLINTPLYLLLN